MATRKQIIDFLTGLPDDTQIVLVCQRHGRPQVLRSDNMQHGEYPSWPLATWEGISEAVQETPCGFSVGDDYVGLQ